MEGLGFGFSVWKEDGKVNKKIGAENLKKNLYMHEKS